MKENRIAGDVQPFRYPTGPRVISKFNDMLERSGVAGKSHSQRRGSVPDYTEN